MIYEYKCQSCGQLQEVWQKMSDPAPQECPQCHTLGQMERVISKTSFALKGSGWYSSDYKKSAPSSPESNDKTEKKSSAAEAPCAASSGACGMGACVSKAEA